MKIAVLGTGMVGQTLASKLVSLGHEVFLGTRDVEKTLSKNEKDAYGNPPVKEWMKVNQKVQLVTFKQAASQGELIMIATSGSGTLPALELAGAENLTNKILLDISNPLDFSNGFPPSLTICNTDSLGEQIQKKYSESRVVKTLNVVNAHIMVNPGQLKEGDPTMFISSNDPKAKEEVTIILKEWFGWKDIIDLGDITTARGTEMLLPLWVRIYGATKNPMFALKVVH